MAAPIKHTCPDINRVIKLLKDIQSTAKEGMKANRDNYDNEQRFKDCEWDIDDIIGSLEDLRKANAALREWGEGLEAEVVELDRQLTAIEANRG
jgi:hypothetical protein